MTSFNFIIYLCTFLPAVMLAYQLTHAKYRWIVLLAASYLFFLLNSGKLLLFLIVSTLSVYCVAIAMEAVPKRYKEQLESAEKDTRKVLLKQIKTKQKWLLTACLLVNFGIIAILKYSPFFNTALNELFLKCGLSTELPVHNYVLPIGISFYTMMAASYVIDVYREVIPADHNLGRVALFLGFFPQIMEGPMCRYSETANDLFAGNPINYKNMTFGLQRVGAGLAKKMIVADRVNNYINWAHMFYDSYDGGLLAISTILYSFQIYMDFSGTMDIVLGMAEIFGVHLPENFRRPFFSKTVSEFWARWHITLGKWFTDYIFYPISMSKPAKKLTKSARKKLGNYYGPLLPGSIALLAVWVCNGLWHGAGWQYLFFGMYYFVIILISRLTAPFWDLLTQKLHIDRESKPYHVFQILRTAFIFNLGELFFRAKSLTVAFVMLKRIICNFSLESIQNGYITNLWLDPKDAVILFSFAVILVIHGIRAERGHDVREEIARMKPVYRMAIYAGLVMAILIFGGYGYGYSYVEPIYANF